MTDLDRVSGKIAADAIRKLADRIESDGFNVQVETSIVLDDSPQRRMIGSQYHVKFFLPVK